ncbi:Uncharacterized protein BM_BM10866 [Brugia malayi]|nr:Uncharacterized protein BM_BM10866 [Brugia malayi]VIO97993.1 Uncharacterized protein BM_BM10866 [Brugia malayi]
MIELQGTLESAGILVRQRIGSLKWENKKALLHIGYHIIEGKEVKLQNPLIVLGRDESLINENRTSTVEAMQTSFDPKMNSVIQNVRSKTADNFKVYRKCVNGKGSYHCW